jgi:multidrug efflux pump subunit AcrB
VLVTLSTLASLLPLAIGTQTNNLFGAIALAAAGGMIAGTLGALFVVPAMIVGRRAQRPKLRPQGIVQPTPLTSEL